MPRFEPIAFGDLGFAGLAAVQRAAFGQQFRPRGAMDRAIDATAAEQSSIRRIDDGVGVERGDVADDEYRAGRILLRR